MANTGAGKMWHEFFNSIAKFGTKFLDYGQGKIMALGIELVAVCLLMPCLTDSPTSTTYLICIK